MDLAALIVNLGVFAATAAAAAVAWVQANIAASAKRDADKAAAQATRIAMEANQIANDAREALSKSATALEEANDIARLQLPKYPWKMARTGSTVEVRNDSRDELLDVTFEGDIHGDITPLEEFPRTVVFPNESLIFDYSKSITSPASATLLLRWRSAEDGSLHEWRQTVH